MMRTGVLRALVLLAGTVILQGERPVQAQRAEPKPVTIFFSSNVSGNFEPCGCTVHPAGGLARRAGVVQDYSQKHDDWVLEADLGDYFEQPGPRAAAVNQLLLESLEKLPIRVMNLASDDLYMWQTLSSETPQTQVISTNLKPIRRSLPEPSPYAVVEVPARELGLKKDLRIGFLGLIDPRRVRPNSGMKATDPLAALEAVKKTVLEKEKADFLILLTDLPRESSEIEPGSLLYQLAEQNPEVAAILNTERRYVLFPPQFVNNAVIVSGVERGRHISRLTFTLDPSGRILKVDHGTIELLEGVPEDEAWRAKQESLKLFQ